MKEFKLLINGKLVNVVSVFPRVTTSLVKPILQPR
jgi:hypothetical protein